MAVKKRKKSRFEFLTRKFPLRMQRKLVMLFMAVVLAFVVLIGSGKCNEGKQIYKSCFRSAKL